MTEKRWLAVRCSAAAEAMSYFCNDHFPSQGKQQYFSRHEIVFPHFSTFLFLHKIAPHLQQCAVLDWQLPLLIELGLRRIEKGNHSFDVVCQLFSSRDHISTAGTFFHLYFHSGNIEHYSASCCCHDVTPVFQCFLFPLFVSSSTF